MHFTRVAARALAPRSARWPAPPSSQWRGSAGAPTTSQPSAHRSLASTPARATPRPAAMFGALKSLLGVGGGAGTACGAACGACDPEVLARCQPPEPGSVTPHAHHVLVKLPLAGWEESVDKEPPIEAINVAVKQNQEAVGGKVKVTAFDDVTPQPAGGAACAYEVLVFPAGLRLSGVPLERVGDAVVEAITQGPAQQERLGGLTLLVCAHAKRDSRCGTLGTQLADCLVALIREQGLEEQVTVLKSSHVGGHVYAGNVLVYGGACSGDWFGGVNANNAADFLASVLGAKVVGSCDPQLRRLWRGRVGLSKEEQKALFEGGIKDIEDLKAP